MMKLPKVSIGVPIYNVEKYIKRCAISLLEQTYDNIEFIFVNDCTPDKSMDILEKVLEQYPGRKNNVHIINNIQNKGIAAVRNTINSLISGDFFLYVDSDDWLEVNAVERLVLFQRETNADLVTFDSIWHYKSKIQYRTNPQYKDSTDMILKILTGNLGNSIWSRFIRTSILKDHNLMVTNGIDVGEDFQLLIPLLYYSDKVCTLNEKLYNYECRNENSYTYSFSESKLRKILESYEITYKQIPYHSHEFNEAYAKRMLSAYIGHMIISCKSMNLPEYYIYIYGRAHKIPKKYWCHIPPIKRVLMYARSYKVACIYVNFMLYLKKIFF